MSEHCKNCKELQDRLDAADEAVRSSTLLEAKIVAMVGWLEGNQPDVFRRGLWDAITTSSND